MLAKDLAEALLENPDCEVTVSVDISTNDDDAQRRAFGEIIEIMYCQGELVLIAVGSTND